MGRSTKIVLFCIAIQLMPFQIQSVDDSRCPSEIKKYKQWHKPSCFCYPRRGDAFAYNMGRDALGLFASLWEWDTIKILVSLFPAFIAARMIDESVQSNFFCHGCHCNKNQFPHWCHDAVRWSIGIPVAVLGSMLLFSKDFELRYTSWMLLLGMPFLVWGKDIIKQFDAKFCLRPWHEDFCKERHKQFPGGFPSGHMAEAVYIAVLFGMRYGAAAAIPLGINAAAVGIVFLNCNRHYLSQLVAGAALGTIVALAANKVIDRRVAEHVAVNFGCDSVGTPSLGVTWRF